MSSVRITHSHSLSRSLLFLYIAYKLYIYIYIYNSYSARRDNFKRYVLISLYNLDDYKTKINTFVALILTCAYFQVITSIIGMGLSIQAYNTICIGLGLYLFRPMSSRSVRSTVKNTQAWCIYSMPIIINISMHIRIEYKQTVATFNATMVMRLTITHPYTCTHAHVYVYQIKHGLMCIA